MQNNQNMRSKAFIHNDEATCFHVVVQVTQKMIVVGHHNFKDRALIKRRWVTQKTSKMGGKLMDKNKQGNCRKSFLFTVGGRIFLEVKVFEEK
jgi:hypothetical protein